MNKLTLDNILNNLEAKPEFTETPTNKVSTS